MSPSSSPRSIGQFAWDTTDDRWHWDAGMFRLHGYRVGAVAVSTELVLERKQDQDRCHAAVLLELSATRDRTFSNYHGILDADGRRRTVLVVGRSRVVETPDEAPSHRLSRGYMIDVTDDESDTTRRAVEQARASTASIQQSLGLLMGSLGLTEEQAFAVMARISSHHNVKVRDLARRFMAAAVSSTADTRRDLSQLLISSADALAAERAARAHAPLPR